MRKLIKIEFKRSWILITGRITTSEESYSKMIMSLTAVIRRRKISILARKQATVPMRSMTPEVST